MLKFLRKQPPGRIIALGFAGMILLGSGLLMLPCCIRPGQSIRYIDALYTAASAVCVTGLVTFDPGLTFTPIGQLVLGLLIQIGGMGVAAVGAGIILMMGKKINLKGRNLIREASNLENGKGAVRFLKSMLLTTLIIELIGAALSFLVFIRDYDFWPAAGYSLFHSVAAFNNSGFDILGLSGDVHSNVSLIPYQNNVLLNLTTCGLVILGGIGFLVIREILQKGIHWKRYSMHAKVVLSVTAVLLAAGTLLFKLSENLDWMGAFFFSMSARTAGFSTYALSEFSNAGMIVLSVLMVIGASPGSTGGGIKTTTFFVLFKGIQASATNKTEKAFKHGIPADAFRKAAVIFVLAVAVILVGTYLLILMDPQVAFRDALVEVTSAFGTVGLSTGITPSLSLGSKLLSIVIMYIGRLGPLTVASLWYFTKGERARYPDGNLAIG